MNHRTDDHAPRSLNGRLRRLSMALAGAAAVVAAPMLQVETAAAGEPTPVVWVGAPTHTATWPNEDGCAGAADQSDQCSLPSVHHRVYPNPSNGEAQGDWAADLQSVQPGEPVVLYAAPPSGQPTEVTATVQAVGPACASGENADGGSRVTVELSSPSGPIGTVTYAHVEPTVATGQVIDRWNSQIGTVGNYTPGSCWGGPHVHVELSSQSNYACYNGTFAPGQAVEATNFVGFLGGSYAATTGQACP